MLWLVPLVAALVPLLICPATLAYFDVTPKIAILLFGTALILLQAGVNTSNVRTLLRASAGRWLAGLLAAEWMFFALGNAFSSNRALSFGGGLWRRFGLLSETALVLFVLLAAGWLAADLGRIRMLLRATVASGALASCYGIAQYFGWDPLLPAQAYQVGEGALTIVRPPGTLGHADYFAAWLVVVVFLGLALSTLEKARMWRVAAGVASGLAAIAILLNGTRAALLGVAVGVVVLLIARQRRIGVRAGVAGLACAGALALFFFSPAGLKLRARLHWSLEDARGGARLLLWRDSLLMSEQRPLAGYGPEMFATEFPRFESAELAAAYPDFYHESPHNMFLDALTTQGMGGLLVLAALCCLGAMAAIRMCRSGNLLGPPLAAALAGVLVAQQFAVFIVATALYFHLLIALLVIVAWSPWMSAEVEKDSARRWVRIPSAVVALLLTGVAVQFVVADHAFAVVQQRIAAGDIAGASEAYRTVLRWQPLGANSDLNYSRAMQQAAARAPILPKRAEAGQQALEAAIRAVGSAEDRQNAWYNLAALLAQENDAQGTERALRNAIAWAPNWFKPHWALARLLAISGYPAEALAEARMAVDRDGGHDPEVAQTLQQLQFSKAVH
ncbi:MAG TPA: O-antigen ligase family protein [Bryobacteraceae bacterium]|nr:O-antigen ligase family protein [Bryobacteraceae bacterium]